MTPNPTPISDWTKIENVFDLIEKDGRVLNEGEKRVIDGQRRINGILFQTVDALLKSFPSDSAPPEITAARDLLKDLPGKEPPGCKVDA